MFQINVSCGIMKTNDVLSSKQRKQFRKIAHHLRPIVTLTNLEISEDASNEVNRAIQDHELIKVKIEHSDRKIRKEMAIIISETTGADLVQTIGKCVVLYKSNPLRNPKLSNVLRYSF